MKRWCPGFRTPSLFVVRTLSLVKAQNFLGLLGAGVPPLLGALTSFAYWGARKELRIKNYQFCILHFAFCISLPSISAVPTRKVQKLPTDYAMMVCALHR